LTFGHTIPKAAVNIAREGERTHEHTVLKPNICLQCSHNGIHRLASIFSFTPAFVFGLITLDGQMDDI
jgi:hypothetical protein